MQIIQSRDKNYPGNLRLTQDFPEKIYLLGKYRKRDSFSVAIIGSRNMSEYGSQVAYRFSFFLAQKGVTIISGLARGIDTIAHKAALAAGGRTIAVLGSGLDIIYPPENKLLAESIIRNGVLISEFALGIKPLAKNFLRRNRIIAALAKAVLVIEGGKRSGTFSTVNYAINFGKDVFAVPGQINSPNSFVPNYLISQGAGVAIDPAELLDTIL